MDTIPVVMVPFRPSAKYIIYKTLPLCSLYFLSIPPVFLINPLFIAVNLLILIAFFYHFFLLCSELYLVTPDMIMVSTGLINRKILWFDPLQIEGLDVIQSRMMGWLGISQICISSSKEIGLKLRFKDVDAALFCQALKLSLNVIRLRQGYTDIVSRLVKLSDNMTNHSTQAS